MGNTDWTGAVTLRDYLTYLFKNNLTNSPEFKALLNLYGRPYIIKLWRDYKDGRTEKLSSSMGRQGTLKDGENITSENNSSGNA